jgi:hypothetical protein
VSWWSVREYVVSLIAVEDWPLLGSPQWSALAVDDPAKIAAVLHGGEHWALRLETHQQARADASRDVSDAVDWSALAREINERRRQRR